MKGRFLRMPHEEFMNQFVPGPDPTAAQQEKFSTFDGIAPEAFQKKEAFIYRALVCCFTFLKVSSSLIS